MFFLFSPVGLKGNRSHDMSSDVLQWTKPQMEGVVTGSQGRIPNMWVALFLGQSKSDSSTEAKCNWRGVSMTPVLFFPGVDSPFFSAIVLFDNPIHFPRVFGGFIERSGPLGSEWTWKIPLFFFGRSGPL